MLGNVEAFKRGAGKQVAAAPPPTTSPTVTSAIVRDFVAGAVIGYPRVVAIRGDGLIYPYNQATLLTDEVVGISGQTALAGALIPVILAGELVYQGWGLTAGKQYYAGASGVLTSVPANQTGEAVVPIGVALDANTLSVNKVNPIYLK